MLQAAEVQGRIREKNSEEKVYRRLHRQSPMHIIFSLRVKIKKDRMPCREILGNKPLGMSIWSWL
jgi:hypothetical protein